MKRAIWMLMLMLPVIYLNAEWFLMVSFNQNLSSGPNALRILLNGQIIDPSTE